MQTKTNWTLARFLDIGGISRKKQKRTQKSWSNNEINKKRTFKDNFSSESILEKKSKK